MSRRAGEHLWVPGGYSTVLPTMDVETYSEAGFIWDDQAQKWRPPRGIKSGGLSAVGAYVYAEHPSTEVLCLCYDLKDGLGVREWAPWMDAPADLLDHIRSGGLIESHHSAFEFLIWREVCQKRYGWPALDLRQTRCSMAKARAYGLPGGLGDACAALGAPIQKDAKGKALIKRFCVPRNPTKTDPRRRILPGEDPEGFRALMDYCRTDVEAESGLSERVPDLSPDLLEVWLLDQEINHRGIAVDVPSALACADIIEAAAAKYAPELPALTGGAVQTASQVQAITNWLHSVGVHPDTLDEDSVDELLAGDLPQSARRVLEIRSLLGAGSVKKLYSILARLASDNRIHGMFVFHKARTGRYAGEGPQPQNLPSSGPEIGGAPWDYHAAEFALQVIPSGLDTVEACFGNALHTVAGCLRSLFCAAPGHDLICSDYRAIEAVVLAALAGEEWRLEVFRTHGLIYETSAARILGTTVDEFIEYKQVHGSHHPMRKRLGKVAELACFTRDTQLLTPGGYVGITDATDKLLWDGESWVAHQGVVSKGRKKVIALDGVRMTPNHPITCGRFWREARKLVSSKSTLRLSLEHASENLPPSGRTGMPMGTASHGSCAHVAGRNTRYSLTPYYGGSRPGVTCVQSGSPLVPRTKKGTTSTRGSSRIPSTAVGCSTGSPPPCNDATTLNVGVTKTTGRGVSRYPKNGGTTGERSSPTVSPCRDGTTRTLRWTAPTAARGTSRVISGLYRDRSICRISAASGTYRLRLTRSKLAARSWKSVYDILQAGPNNRFTIKTRSGHLIVHNSGYAGWVGAWKAFGADAFFSDDEIKSHVLAWRAASPSIVEFWGGQRRNWCEDYYGIEGAAVLAVLNPGQAFGHRGLYFQMAGDVLFLRLLSGRLLAYHQPRLEPGDRGGHQLTYMTQNTNPKYGGTGWVRLKTYGGRLTENIVQATSWDVLVYAQRNLAREGYPTVLHVHDENAAEVPSGARSVEEYEEVMGRMPPWAEGWPIIAAGGWRGSRYRKD